MGALHITKENFDQEVLNSSQPVIIDFWASWCGPCQMLLPVIEELAQEVQTAKICKINVDEQPELAQQFQVMTIPTLVSMVTQPRERTTSPSFAKYFNILETTSRAEPSSFAICSWVINREAV